MLSFYRQKDEKTVNCERGKDAVANLLVLFLDFILYSLVVKNLFMTQTDMDVFSDRGMHAYFSFLLLLF